MKLSPPPSQAYALKTDKYLRGLVENDVPRGPTQCKYCYQVGLQWVHDPGSETVKAKWLLVGVVNGLLARHSCPAMIAALAKKKQSMY